MDIQNKKLSNDVFYKERAEVLTQWPTGKDVDLEEAIAYHKAMPEYRNFAKKLSDAKKGMTEEEFRMAKAQLKGGFILGQESAYNRMNSMGNAMILQKSNQFREESGVILHFKSQWNFDFTGICLPQSKHRVHIFL